MPDLGDLGSRRAGKLYEARSRLYRNQIISFSKHAAETSTPFRKAMTPGMPDPAFDGRQVTSAAATAQYLRRRMNKIKNKN